MHPIRKVINKKTLIPAALLVMFVLITPYIRFPISWAFPLFGMNEPEYIPFDYEKSYITTDFGGRNTQVVHYHFIGKSKSATVTVSSKTSWADDPKWDKETLIPGTKYFYREKGRKQYLYWKDKTKHGEEYEFDIEYQGGEPLSHQQLIEMAKSVEV